MRKILFFFLFSLTFVCCSVEEEDSHAQKKYIVNDLVEIAKQYGMEFEPLKDFKEVTAKEVQAFKNELELLSRIKGTYPIKNIKKGEAVMFRNVSKHKKLKTRSELELIEEPEYEYPTKVEGTYTCNCKIQMYHVLNKVKNTTETFVFVEASVSGLYGTAFDRISNKGGYAGVYYDDFDYTFNFSGHFQYGAAGYGFINVYYSGIYDYYLDCRSQISWSFRG